jgi:sugar O-acyltransferase (sialic acid O-acetyltransferase NeuD family)
LTQTKRRNRLLLLGGGGHGRVVADMAELLGWTGIAFLDDRWPDLQSTGDWPVLGVISDAARFGETHPAAIVTVGDGATRQRLSGVLRGLGFTLPTLVHPSAVISPRATLGQGVVVMANVVVNSYARVGDDVILNTACTIDHDCRLSDSVHVSPGANLSGDVTVGERSWIGAGAAVREGIRIGFDVVVGAGAAVVSNLPDGVFATGVPARARPPKL